MDILWALVGTVTGLAAGAAVGLALARARAAGVESEARRLRTELDGARAEAGEARAEAGQARAEASSAREAAAAATSGLAAERRAGEEKLELLQRTAAEMEQRFKALSADALDRSSRQFLDLAAERFSVAQKQASGDLAQRQQAFEALVKPLGDSVGKLETQVEAIERARQHAYGNITEQLRTLAEGSRELRSETANLVTALRRPSARGRWGELQLRRVVEMAGMVAHCDFQEQATVTSDDGRLRPDLVVRLPGDKTVVVDAKAPLDAYLDATEATDEETSRARLDAHARQIRTHVDKLAAKQYWQQFREAPDFVVLFVPGDALLSAAYEHDASLMEHAVANRVLIATPVTLIALLRAVAYGWQQESIAENARQIAALGAEMQSRLSTYVDHVAKVGRGLDQAVDAYNKSVGSLETRVLVTARKFSDLGVSDREIAEPARLDRRARELALAAVPEAAGDEPGVGAAEEAEDMAAGSDGPATGNVWEWGEAAAAGHR